jgi:hypothetical protein
MNKLFAFGLCITTSLACKDESTQSATKHASGNTSEGQVLTSATCRPAPFDVRTKGDLDKERAALVASIKEISISLPPKTAGLRHEDVAKNTARIRFLAKASGEIDSLKIDEALDLYDRSGTIAQVSGGIFATSTTPTSMFEFKLTLSPEGASKLGTASFAFPQVSAGAKATIVVECEWGPQSELASQKSAATPMEKETVRPAGAQSEQKSAVTQGADAPINAAAIKSEPVTDTPIGEGQVGGPQSTQTAP